MGESLLESVHLLRTQRHLQTKKGEMAEIKAKTKLFAGQLEQTTDPAEIETLKSKLQKLESEARIVVKVLVSLRSVLP